jgi:hypothetical protein
MRIFQRIFYEEVKGDSTAGSSGEETAPKASDFLKADLAKARAKNKEIMAQLAKFEGIDPDEYLSLKTQREQAEQEQAAKRGEFDKLLKAERDKSSAAELRALEKVAAANESLVKAELSAAFVANGGKAEHVDNFLILAKAKLVKNEDGQYVVPDTFVNAKGEAIADFKSFTNQLASTDLGFAFNPVNNAAGSGKTGGQAPGSGQPRSVSPAEANQYLSEIAAGTVVVG